MGAVATVKSRVGTFRARAYQAEMLLRFPMLTQWGVFSCRHIAGSATWSQHSWGNAVDLGTGNKDRGDRAYAYALANAGRLGIEHLLWQVPDHYDHIHADFVPNYSGTPPCAGGPDALEAVSVATTTGCPPGYTRSTDGFWCINDRTGKKVPPANPPALIPKIAGGVTGFLGDLPKYLVIAAGGVLLLAGVAVVAVGVSGQGNKVATAAQAIPPVRRAMGRRSAVREQVRTSERQGAREEAGVRVSRNVRTGRVTVASRRTAAARTASDEATVASRRAERAAASRARLRAIR